MGTKIRAILFAIFLFILVFGVLQFFAPDKFLAKIFNKSGTLRVESSPTTSVFLDNVLIGQTPLQMTLKDGVYLVKLVPESGGEKSLVTWSQKVRVFQSITTYINKELAVSDILSSGEILSLEKSNSPKGQILVNTDPPGVFVALDGEERGIAPLFMDNVNQGEHELTIRGEGFLPRSIKINIVNGYKLLADFKLAVDEEYKKKKSEEKESEKKKKEEALIKKQFVIVSDTPTGWLRVRSLPSIDASESAKITPGEKYPYLIEEQGWYQIEYAEGKTGWVLGDYVKKTSE